MSDLVRLRLKALGYFQGTTHQDREQIDREIERRKGMNCDRAMKQGLVNDEEFKRIVEMVLLKRRKEVIPAIV